MASFENVKIGDEFIVHTRNGEKLAPVTKVTKKRLMCKNCTFLKLGVGHP